MKTNDAFNVGKGTLQSPARNLAEADEIALAKGQLHHWNGDRVGLVIEVQDAPIWITQQGDTRDFVISPGERFHVTRRGRVVAQSLGPTARIFARRRRF